METILVFGIPGYRLVFSWAFLEAVVLPLPPEILLIPLVLFYPDHALRLASIAVAGSLTGGLISYCGGRRWGNEAVALLKRLPGVNPNRVIWASSMLKNMGVRFIAISPWVVLPYKVTSVISGQQRIDWLQYLTAGMVGRGTRLIGICLAVATVARDQTSLMQEHLFVALAISYVAVATIVWTIRQGVLRFLLPTR